ncbi:hypothetical protein [Kitasatospora cineracea]|uniref:Uncharacterized protein n=1 Tax=Kitasatospora cineracea TaxID=88074 RepID=A0A3N4R282_9ACTN|nr:hypothetical protein [Kitasatospora cineracea]RPE27312.1 hypothetical protein EDD38_7457 [Kitasatospora cineracea]
MHTTDTATFASITKRYGTQIAALAAAGNNTTPADTTTITPREFAGLVQDAAGYLGTFTHDDRLQGVADELRRGYGYLLDALGAPEPQKPVLLQRAAPLIAQADGIGDELDL